MTPVFDISLLNKIFDNRIRLGIMSALMVNDEINFKDLKSLLSLTDGNLASHMKALEEAGFISVEKSFIGRKTNTSYTITKQGKAAFKQHLEGLEKLLKNLD